MSPGLVNWPWKALFRPFLGSKFMVYLPHPRRRDYGPGSGSSEGWAGIRKANLLMPLLQMRLLGPGAAVWLPRGAGCKAPHSAPELSQSTRYNVSAGPGVRSLVIFETLANT